MLIDVKTLAARLGAVTVIDGSSHMPDTGRNADAEFLAAHIPGAQRFNIEVVADTTNPLPHTMPSPASFARHVSAMGVTNDKPVVVYEAGAPFSAPRVVWMFKAMGHPDVMMLSGGFAAWLAQRLPVARGPAESRSASWGFVPSPRPGTFVNADTVADALAASGQVIDVRSAERFAGTAPEPRPGVRAGHMRGALNLPYTTLSTEDGTLKTDDELAAIFKDAGVDLSKPVIASCGSGVTAAVAVMALTKLGTPAAVYDGSWTEWGGDENRPIVTATDETTPTEAAAEAQAPAEPEPEPTPEPEASAAPETIAEAEVPAEPTETTPAEPAAPPPKAPARSTTAKSRAAPKSRAGPKPKTASKPPAKPKAATKPGPKAKPGPKPRAAPKSGPTAKPSPRGGPASTDEKAD
ncbi:MAG: 3-mercaptopyruvate sulfurtransferase [Pseudomonadota bacterium]